MIELLTRGVAALERIAAALEQALQAPAGSEPGTKAVCTHPPDDRIELGGMGESDGFQCRACGVHVAPQPVGVS